MEENKSYSLSELSSFYDIILPDTCALSNCLEVCLGRNKDSIEDRVRKSEEQYKSYSFWKEFIIENPKDNILLYEGVLGELNEVKKVKFTRKFKGNHVDNNFKNLSKNLRYAISRKNNLIKVMENKGLFLTLNEEEQVMCGNFSKAFQYLLTERNFNLSGVDFSLLMTGMALSQKRGNVAIISNDFSILRSWTSALAKKEELVDKLDFYTREESDGFLKRPHAFW